MTSALDPTNADLTWFEFFQECKRLSTLARARRAARQEQDANHIEQQSG